MVYEMRRMLSFCAVLWLAGGCAHQRMPAVAANAFAGPVADHHQHIISPAAAALVTEPPQPAIEVPEDLARVLRLHAEQWDKKAGLAELYTHDSLVLDVFTPTWIRGREKVAEYMSTLFARPFRITPIAYEASATTASVTGYFTRGEGASLKHFGYLLLTLEKGGDGVWRITAETPSFPDSRSRTVVPSYAEQRIPELDAAGIRRAAVLSAAYWFGSPAYAPVENEYEKVRAENDWIIAEVSRFPERLVAFCSFNPLKDYAVEELERCVASPHVRGIKLHFANSDVDVRDPEHVAKVRRVFAAANDRKMAIVAHLWTDDRAYGAEDAKIFLEQILPAAPNVTVQIAHFAGGGPGYTDDALGVYAAAIQAHDPRTKNLYFDIATVADRQTEAVLRTFADRIRQVGPERVLFGTDLAPPAPRQSWLTFRTTVPLTEDEFRIIAANVAPYLR